MKPMSRDKTGVDDLSDGFMVNEIFYSIQGEGTLTGVPMVFVRFAKCNLRCSVRNIAGFNCDTDFEGYMRLTTDEIIERVRVLGGDACEWILLTGGEPTLQIDERFVEQLHREGYKVGIETNGTNKVPNEVDHITVSPKSAEHTIEQRSCDDLKLVRSHGQVLGFDGISATHRLVSVPFNAQSRFKREDLEWCLDLVKKNRGWRLSLQTHKFLGER
jgi:7-carboxy-7-deazaguanine synthase